MAGADPDVRSQLLGVLDELGLAAHQIDDHAWWFVLAGDHKREIPVVARLGEWSLRVTAFATPPPDENREDVYRLLLMRNRRHAPAHFALDDDGAVIVVGRIASGLVDAAHVDELLGVVLAEVDEAFDQVLRCGFASYIAAEQRWRAQAGLPPNPVSADSAGTRRTYVD